MTMTPSPGAAPPHDLAAEQNVLGAMLLTDKVHYNFIIEIGLTPESFYRGRHRAIFEAMQTLLRAGEPIDVFTVIEQLRRSGKLDEAGGPAEVDALTAAVPAVGNLSFYAETVRGHHLRRDALHAAYQIQADVFDLTISPHDAVTAAAKTLVDLSAPRGARGPQRFIKAGEKALENAFARETLGTGLQGPPTGIAELDEVLHGCRPGAVYIIGARPSVGKSVLGAQIAEHVASTGSPALMFALEMEDDEVASRLLAAGTPINFTNINKGAFTASQRASLIEAVAAREHLPLWIDDNADYGLPEISAITRQLYQRTSGALRVVVIDYLQLVRLEKSRDSRNDRIGEVTRGLKRLARELGITIIALSQLSRDIERRADPRPTLADLRDSGNIEQDADVVVFIHPVEDAGGRDDVNAWLIVAKNRNARRGVDVGTRFTPELQRFDGIKT